MPVGVLDITFYRDDIGLRAEAPEVRETRIDFDVGGRTVVLVDDVLFTGRTIRSALDALIDFGRPRQIQRSRCSWTAATGASHRADYVGKNVPTRAGPSGPRAAGGGGRRGRRGGGGPDMNKHLLSLHDLAETISSAC